MRDQIVHPVRKAARELSTAPSVRPGGATVNRLVICIQMDWALRPHGADLGSGRRERTQASRREPLPPARVLRRPAEFALGLRVRCSSGLGHHHRACFAGEQPPDEARYPARRRGAELLRQLRQPVGHRGRVVVDYVVDPAGAVLERRDASAASAMWMNDHTPAPLPTTGNFRVRTISNCSPPRHSDVPRL